MLIFLTGFMGSGKSFLGNKLANELGFEFLDLDELIVQKEKCAIKNIFAQKGEEYFRKAEQTCLKTLAGKSNLVVATGGGTPCFFDNMEWMNRHGITVYLRCSVALLKERLKDEQEHRPLLKDFTDHALEVFIKNKLAERNAFYEMARFVVYQRRKDNAVLERVLKWLRPIC